MAKFAHTQQLSKIFFNKTITVYCPLGQDYYTASINVTFTPNEFLMDYLDEEEYFKKLSGESAIIEDLVATIYYHYVVEYQPAYLKVSVEATNATHFPVIVEKES